MGVEGCCLEGWVGGCGCGCGCGCGEEGGGEGEEGDEEGRVEEHCWWSLGRIRGRAREVVFGLMLFCVYGRPYCSALLGF